MQRVYEDQFYAERRKIARADILTWFDLTEDGFKKRSEEDLMMLPQTLYMEKYDAGKMVEDAIKHSSKKYS
jgi:hypothetical protein